ncbi:hypothetical protein GO986_17965 [Deinococcus sp. HMF7620]|uniref:Ryanodine receptor Ryr domain-containing protein n=1 Tax=Deinococcus arboris TaxID=2682977 RepID=A0A7C9M8J9_9DEIO|nr:RyR domain-containing protein [Deinococcus arboris]MVN88625.1 hypothetical protein [Deinococcus arboris]
MTLILTLAALAHEANRHYCASIGDTSQVPWDAAPDWQKDSAVKGIEGALAGNTPAQQHESWMAEKVATGWVYGDAKDPDAKTHPCLVPYDQLPDDQKRKDHLYSAVVKAAHGALTADLTPRATTASLQRPSIGRQVHYVLADGQHRAATVVNAWPTSAQNTICNLTVYLDGCNDLNCADASQPASGKCHPFLVPPGANNRIPGVLTVGSAHQDEDTRAPGTWHWPERV